MLVLQHKLWLRRNSGGKRRRPDMTLDERSSTKRFGNGVESMYMCLCGLINKSSQKYTSQHKLIYVMFEVLTAATMKNATFWYVSENGFVIRVERMSDLGTTLFLAH
jgi:hypothetical protein